MGVWLMGMTITFMLGGIVFAIICAAIISGIHDKQFREINEEALNLLGLSDWMYLNYDDIVYLKSSKAVNDYTVIKFFKDNRFKVDTVNNTLNDKFQYGQKLEGFLNNNDLRNKPMYSKLEDNIKDNLNDMYSYNILVQYRSPAGKSTNEKVLQVNKGLLQSIIDDPSQIMGKAEYNKYIKEKNQEALDQKHHAFYEMVNNIIDLANQYREKLVINGDKDELDRLVASLYDKTVNKIQKIKSIDSEEWGIIEKVITGIEQDINKIVDRNKRIIDYYDSDDFHKIKDTCNSLMETQKDFNEYINEKANSISTLFGSRIVRNETVNDDEYNYIRPYKKSITPFTAEVSSTVFASAENNPLDYIVKYFYPSKDVYPEQIQKLQHLVEELETLKDAKLIIDNYKKDYQQYITDVPSYVMENDEDGFYSRLGFANISESVLTVEYKFSYTSQGGMAQRSFTVPMNEETIVELINRLQSKLTMSAFVKEQRNLMTSKLRQYIKERDHYTCKFCGNSTYKEPNLLLEIDHIIPVAKGGCTVEDNLQTLCWKCNRVKSSKIL